MFSAGVFIIILISYSIKHPYNTIVMAFTSNSSFLAETFEGAGVLWDTKAAICGYDLRFLPGGNYYGKYFAIMKMTHKHELYILY